MQVQGEKEVGKGTGREWCIQSVGERGDCWVSMAARNRS